MAARGVTAVLLVGLLVAGAQAAEANAVRKDPSRGIKSMLWNRESGPDNDGSSSIFRPMVVLLGDSITEFGSNDGGWQQQLTRDYIRKADVINRGFGGYNSRWGTFLIDDIINSFGAGRIKLVTICFGANDAVMPDAYLGYLHVPVDEYTANLKAMVSKLKVAGVDKIIVVSPPPVDDTNYRFKDGARSNKNLKAYAEAANSVAKEAGLPFVDIFHKMQDYPEWRKALIDYDGLHMAREGQTFIHNNVMRAITDWYPAISPRRLPLHFPAYSKVNAARPEDTFNTMYGYKVDRGLPKNWAPAAPAPAPVPAPAAAAAAPAAPAAPAAAAPAGAAAVPAAAAPAPGAAAANASGGAAGAAANARNAGPAPNAAPKNAANAAAPGSGKGSEGKRSEGKGAGGGGGAGKGDNGQAKFVNSADGNGAGRRMRQ